MQVKITKEQLRRIITEEYIKVILKEKIGISGKQEILMDLLQNEEIDRREFLKKLGGALGAGAGLGSGLGFLLPKAKEKEPEKPVEKLPPGKGRGMLPGLVPGDKDVFMWEPAPFRIASHEAVYVPIDQLPDNYRIPGGGKFVKEVKTDLLKEFGKHPLSLAEKELTNPGRYPYSEVNVRFGYDPYPGYHWPKDEDDNRLTDFPNGQMLQDTHVGKMMFPVEWSVLYQVYQLKQLAEFPPLESIEDDVREEATLFLMKTLNITDEYVLEAMSKEAHELRKAGIIKTDQDLSSEK